MILKVQYWPLVWFNFKLNSALHSGVVPQVCNSTQGVEILHFQVCFWQIACFHQICCSIGSCQDFLCLNRVQKTIHVCSTPPRIHTAMRIPHSSTKCVLRGSGLLFYIPKSKIIRVRLSGWKNGRFNDGGFYKLQTRFKLSFTRIKQLFAKPMGSIRA